MASSSITLDATDDFLPAQDLQPHPADVDTEAIAPWLLNGPPAEAEHESVRRLAVVTRSRAVQDSRNTTIPAFALCREPRCTRFVPILQPSARANENSVRVASAQVHRFGASCQVQCTLVCDASAPGRRPSSLAVCLSRPESEELTSFPAVAASNQITTLCLALAS